MRGSSCDSDGSETNNNMIREVEGEDVRKTRRKVGPQPSFRMVHPSSPSRSRSGSDQEASAPAPGLDEAEEEDAGDDDEDEEEDEAGSCGGPSAVSSR